MLKRILLFLTVLFWPLSLYFSNTLSDFLLIVSPSLLLFLYYVLYKKNSWSAFLPLIVIPLIAPKLLVLSIILLLVHFKHALPTSLLTKTLFLFLIAFLILFAGKNFWGQTVFHFDYEGQQEVFRNTNLYDNTFVARLFHNKAKIFIDKIDSNMATLVDPTNYFFAFEPREIKVDNQNIQKFPFMFLLFFLVGLYESVQTKKNVKDKEVLFIFAVGAAAIVNLSLLTVFDRTDFILWLPMTLLIWKGIHRIETYTYAWPLEMTAVLFSLFELLKIITK